MSQIAILDFGGQYVENIRRCFLELGIDASIYPWDAKASELKGAVGIVFSGGPYSVYQKKAPLPDKKIFSLGKPILGLCYGHQSIAHLSGGRVEKGAVGEYGFSEIELDTWDRLFRGLEKKEICWMSHGDAVSSLPKGFQVIASSPESKIAAFRRGNLYGLQFHPEVSHTPKGARILGNFASLCGLGKGSWDVKGFIDEVDRAAARIDGKVLIAASGGVDSTVAAFLCQRALGKRLYPVHVDSGLMRKGESRKVIESLGSHGLDVELVDAKKRFLRALKGALTSDSKRKAIGKTFIDVFDEVARRENIDHLIQGTIAPDVIESSRGKSKTHRKAHGGSIKLHHNVGGLPKAMKLKVFEPLRPLFKHQVRLLGKGLRVPRYLLERQPFPGPGLATRVSGEVTGKKLELLRDLTEVVERELAIYTPAQYFAALVEGKTMDNVAIRAPVNDAWILRDRFVGVKGDERLDGKGIVIDSYPMPWLGMLKLQSRITGLHKDVCRVFWLLSGEPGKSGAILRAVDSTDFMTASPTKVDFEHLERIGEEIVRKFRLGFAAYEITTKPPSTIEII